MIVQLNLQARPISVWFFLLLFISMKIIEPRNLKGFRDYLPAEQIARAKMFEKIKKVFELFGFEPLDTPVLEHADILSGKAGEESEQLMYRFKDQGDRDVAMRYDFTVPLARVVAQYQNDLPRPFKRYQIAPVWRAENTQKGRYREFYQCDADVVGAEAGVADAECIAMIEEVLFALGLKKFKIRINNRKILNAIMSSVKIPVEKFTDAIRVIDKLEKVGAKAVVEELVEKVGINKDQAEDLIRLASTNIADIAALKTFVAQNISEEEQGQKGFEELNKVFLTLIEFGVKNVQIDLSIARGLDYYTSTIFETIITENSDSQKFGSVASGGRYDKLISIFTGKDIPAVGMSIGIDRLFSALQELGLVEKSNIVKVLILNFGSQFEAENLKMLYQLRSAGINSEFYYQDVDKKKQFAYAEAKSIPYAIIYGEDEQESDQATVRNLKNREQQSIKKEQLVNWFKNIN